MNKKIVKALLLVGLVLTVIMYSCKNGNTSLGNNENVSVELTDSVDVLTSTYLLDSLPTNKSGTLLTGRMNDLGMGKISSESYMEFKVKTNLTSVPENAVFDSLNFVLHYNRYYYGDTTILSGLQVHRLNQEIVLRKLNGGNEAEERPVFVDGPALYSTSTFGFDAVPLGSKTYQPRPRSKDSLIVPLSPALGREFLQFILNKDKKITDPEKFLEYFRGIVVKNGNSASIVGFYADSANMNLHYNFRNNEGLIKKGAVIFSLNTKDKQFNHIEADRKGTPLEALTYTSKEIKSELTGGGTFLQAGTGIVTKLSLPGLDKFLTEQKLSVNKAELVIETSQETYADFKPPSSLILFVANSVNVPKSIVTVPFGTGQQLAQFQAGGDVGGNGKYVFKLTEYINNARKNGNKNKPLLLSVPMDQLFNTVNRLNIKNKKQIKSVKLYMYYTKF